jgi:GNAT superfamily N-acetyltransferase
MKGKTSRKVCTRFQDVASTGSHEKANYSWELMVAADSDVEPTVAHLSGHMKDQQREAFKNKLQRYVIKLDRDLLLSKRGGQVLGLVCVIEQAELPSSIRKHVADWLLKFACTTQLLVHPRVRKQGIGKSLQLQAEQWAKERSKDGLWLVTHRMAYWYQSHLGYQEVDRIKVKNTEKVVMAKEF